MVNEVTERVKTQSVPGKASIITFGARLAALPFPAASSALMRGFVHLVKPSARVLADSGLRMEILSRSPKEEPTGLNIDLHSDSSGKGGRADSRVSFELEVEVEYGEEPEVVRRMRTVRNDETDVGWKTERETRFNDDLEMRGVESIVLPELHAVTEWWTERNW